ncbi:bifunctional 5,10-methylenetetrahydrofolate dehydrogenase/5,10-methenyltetrahydrofolate cyclohydrolase [Candidatus Woesearchaeota archaeon]|nr:bifunctional 5,10-methylenetetrahydrofolate dehydrogenase/5,10-methenyltetrahydrofolate cyclohydrolase [Candidatus Woesearchaeota archaeon]
MPANIIDGKDIAEKILDSVKERVSKLKEKPKLALVLVGNNPASEVYVNFKEKDCLKCGCGCDRYNLPEDIDEIALLDLVTKLNNDPGVHGILVQLPLPKHINENLIMDSILPHKDVDGFTPVNLGNLVNDNNFLEPATARACIALIESVENKIEGKNAVVVGRSSIVGKPVALLLLQKNATATICHSKTKNLKEHTKNADILVVAVGKAGLIKRDMVKEGAVVIDVGISRVNGKIVGDVDFDSVKEVAGFLTPVPGGVGPMTRAMLLDNLLMAYRLKPKM